MDSAISGKADLSALDGKADISSLNGKADLSTLNGKADISAVHGDYIADGNCYRISANLCYTAFNTETDWTAHNLTSEQDYHLSAESEYAYSWKSDWEWLTLDYSADRWRFRFKIRMYEGEEWWDAAEGEWQAGEDAIELYHDDESWKMTRKASPKGKLATVGQLAEIPQLNDGRGNMISADLSYRQTQAFYDGWTVTGNGTGGELSADGGDT